MSSRKKPLTCPLPENVKQFVEVKQVQQDGVIVFKDGKTLLPNFTILCNGYDFSFPFLDETCGLSLTGQQEVPSSIHKHVFNAIHPSMAFIGFSTIIVCFPTLGCNLVGYSQSLSMVWSGKVTIYRRNNCCL